MCLGCHNIPGYQASFPEVHRVPMIAGQTATYIESALAAYKTGERKHPTMRGVADQLSEQDIKDIAAYYSKLAGEAPAPEKLSREPSPQVAALLQKAACVSCHGANFSKPIDPSYPKLGGQYYDYIAHSLEMYRDGDREHALMSQQAKSLTDQQIADLAAYFGSRQTHLRDLHDVK